MVFAVAALLMGFLGSFHCAGMCGPIALSLPVQPSAPLAGRLLYNIGRITTYILLGFLVGLIGHAVAWAGFQRALSVGAGVLILAAATGFLVHRRLSAVNLLLVRFTSRIKKQFRSLFGHRTAASLFMIGVVSGLLPCGFVYVALASAAATGHYYDSMAFMALFGAGTVPMMLFISLAGNFFGSRFNRFARQATPYVAIAVAALLISRGLQAPEHACCHH